LINGQHPRDMRNRALALFLFSMLFAAVAPTLGGAAAVAQSPSESAAAPTPCPTAAAESAAPSASAVAIGVGGAAAVVHVAGPDVVISEVSQSGATESAIPEASGTPGPSPCPTPIDLAPYLTAELTMVNLASVTINLDVLIIDPDTKQRQSLATQDVEPQGFVSEKVLPLPYTIEFTKQGDELPYASCTVNMTDVQAFDFAALDDAVAVDLRGAAPTDLASFDPNELWTDTSSLCQPPASASPSQSGEPT
jgi:hypothetical protein